VERLVSEQLLQAETLTTILQEAIKPPAPAKTQKQAEREWVKLKKNRERLIDLTVDGLITRAEFAARSTALEQAIREAEKARTPLVAQPTPDVAALARSIVRVFARFPKLPFEDKRELLQNSLREITVSDKGIVTVSFSGGFLSTLNAHAKLCPHSRPPL
jgi:hypothetical protein